MEKKCFLDDCLKKVYFVCSCQKFLCEKHLETHSSAFPSHETGKVFKAVHEKIKKSILEQAQNKKKVLEGMIETISSKVLKIHNVLDNFFIAWKVQTQSRITYLEYFIKDLQEFGRILINEQENLAEELDCWYKSSSPDFFDLEDYLDKYFKSIQVQKFQGKSLNKALPIESKLKITESEGIFIQGVSSSVLCLALSQDEKVLAMGCLDKTIRLWETKDFNQTNILKGHSNRVLCLCFTDSRDFLASGSRDNSILIWNLQQKTSFTLTGHTSDVTALVFKNPFLVSGSADKTILIWRVNPYELVHSFHNKTEIRSLVVTSNIKLIVFSSLNRFLTFWDTFSAIKEEVKVKKNSSVLALTPDEQIMASVAYDKSIFLWSVKSKKCLNVLKHNKKVVSFGIASHALVSVSSDRTVHVWEVSSGSKLSDFKANSSQITTVLTFDNAQKIVTICENKTVCIFNIGLKTQVSCCSGHSDEVLCIASTNDMKFLISGGRDDSIRIWDTHCKKQVAVLLGHKDYVQVLAVSNNNKYLFSGSLDSTVKVWDLDSMSHYLDLVGHKTPIIQISPTSDQKFLLTKSEDGRLIIWDIDSFSCYQTAENPEDLSSWFSEYPELF